MAGSKLVRGEQRLDLTAGDADSVYPTPKPADKIGKSCHDATLLF